MDSSQTGAGPDQNQEHRYPSGGHEADAFLKTVVRSIFPLLICVSLSVGWWIPLFYDWSGANQGYSPPIVEYVFRGFLIACTVSLLILPLLPRLERVDPHRNPLIGSFGVRVVVAIVVTMMAGLFTFRDATWIAIGIASVLYPLLCAVKLGVASRSVRWRVVSLYSCLYLPFVWICVNDVFQGAVKQGSWSFLPLLAGAPALLCSLYIGRFAGHHNAFTDASAMVVAGLEVIVGLWIIQLGTRRAIAYQIVLLAISTVTSCGLFALLRA